MSFLGASINTSSPISAGLAGVGIGPALVHPSRGVIAPAGGFLATRYGKAALVDGAVGLSIGAFPAQTDTTEFSLFLVAESPDALASIGIGYRNGGGPGTSFAKLMPSNGAAAIPKLDYYSNSVARSISGGTYAGANVLVGIKRGLTLELWVNGKLESTVTYTTGQLTINTATCYYGPDEIASHTVAMVTGAFWPTRALLPAEIAALYAKPFQLIRGMS